MYALLSFTTRKQGLPSIKAKIPNEPDSIHTGPGLREPEGKR
jgi:hypothetical protein